MLTGEVQFFMAPAQPANQHLRAVAFRRLGVATEGESRHVPGVVEPFARRETLTRLR
jgi:hypothetical protein